MRELTVARIDRFLKVQRAKSYSQAKQSRTILSMLLGFAPVVASSRRIRSRTSLA